MTTIERVGVAGNTTAKYAETETVISTELKRVTTRGALVSVVGQVANTVLRTGSMIAMARLLTPKDFGLVGMVAAVTGFLGLFRDLGLSMATVQRASITDAQISTLFWVNLAAGGILTGLCTCLAPVLAAFYAEPRLFWVTAALGTSFLFNGAAAQHRALLQRSMRFTALAIIESAAVVSSLAVGIGMALGGCRYWALVGTAVSQQAASAIGAWLATRWVPTKPRWRSGIRSMLTYGGTVTVTNMLAYLAYNADKVLLGRFWGAEALGIYGRAYQLINLPTESLNSTIGQVALPALSRLQNDPSRLRNYFLKGYGLFLSLVLPVTMSCALFAEDIVRVFLGPQWNQAVPIFRLLAPTILSFALVHPFAWLLQSTGQVVRSLQISFVVTPLLIGGYALGLSYGSSGVAAGFSGSMMVLAVPVILWAKHGSVITASSVLRAVLRPGLGILAAAGISFAIRPLLRVAQPALVRLLVEVAFLFGVYMVFLLLGSKQRSFYMGLVRETGLWPLERKFPQSRGNTVVKAAGILVLMAFVWMPTRLQAKTYTTVFSTNQNPISEGGNWINGKTTGLDWSDVAVTNGFAYGLQPGPAGFDDATALLTGAWGSNQTVTATIHAANQQAGNVWEEVELRLRSSLSAHLCTGYEVYFSMRNDASAYVEVTRWNGALNDFSNIDSRTGPQCVVHDGDEVKASIISNTITAYIRGVPVLQVTDNTWTNGNPGMGFYLFGATGVNTDYGFYSFTATDGMDSPVIQITPAADPASGVRLAGNGIPNRNYTFEFKDALSDPNWRSLGAATSDVSGVFLYVDSPPPGTATRFYRVTSW